MILTGSEVFNIVKKHRRMFSRYGVSPILNAIIRCIEEGEKAKGNAVREATEAHEQVAAYAIVGYDPAEGPDKSALATYDPNGQLVEVARATCGASHTDYQSCFKKGRLPEGFCVNTECGHNSGHEESTDGQA